MQTHRFLFLCIVLALISTNVSAANYSISAETGETYIQWAWKTTNITGQMPPLDIYLDDNKTPVITNYTATTYLQTHISSDERHNIALYNTTARLEGNSSMVIKATATTLKPAYVVYILLIICVALLILCFAFGELTRLLLMSVLNIVLCAFGVGMSAGRGSIPYLFIGLGILTGIIFIANGLPQIREGLNWW